MVSVIIARMRLVAATIVVNSTGNKADHLKKIAELMAVIGWTNLRGRQFPNWR